MTEYAVPPNKLIKMESEIRLDSFELKEILRNDANSHMLCLHLVEKVKAQLVEEIQNGAPKSAVLIASKTPFDAETISGILSDKTSVSTTVDNDIYKNCQIFLPPELNALKGTLIYPATKKHVEKYRAQDLTMVSETADQYFKITLPYLENNESQFSLKWIVNLFEHKAESERIIHEDMDPEIGFILAPDLKWSGVNVETLYIQAIARKPGIKSIRSLTAEHLPLLKNMYITCCKAIKDRYGVDESQMRIFLHYQPSYYHLHIHFLHLKAEPLGILVGQAHLLQDVIDNIEMNANYYQTKTLRFNLKINDPLLSLLTK